MRYLPLRSISILDFRCLEGTTEIPLDAPIVLIHGPNGTGKTSGAIRDGVGLDRSDRQHAPTL